MFRSLAIAAVALAVPVTLQGRQGSYLYGLCGQGSLILAGLLDYLCAQQKLRGAGFTVAVPATPEQAALLQDKGFARAFALRCLPREVARNLWSQAEFDSVTAKKLCELREKFWPDTVQFTPERMAVVLGTPEAYLSRTKPTLLISFGRSGNSPESVGAVDAAESVCDNVYHLFVTCNKNGALSKRAAETHNCYAINLTDETHDQSFAMTSSYSNMYLATYLCFHLNELEETVEKVRKIAAAGQNFLDNHYSVAQQIVDEYNFERIVYLGSNTLKGTSQESALKMLELTAGRVVTMYDTPMGFRHGPKSIVDDTTLTVVYLSDEAYTRQYEVDLLKEMSGQRKGNKIVVVMSSADEAVSALADYTVVYDMKEENENILLGLDYILFAQTLAVLKSLSLDITPDNPCPTGEVNRVVKGVTLYPYTRK